MGSILLRKVQYDLRRYERRSKSFGIGQKTAKHVGRKGEPCHRYGVAKAGMLSREPIKFMDGAMDA